MYMKNCTIISELLIIGFYSLHDFKIPVFCVLFLTYSVTCLENFLIIFLVITSIRLHSPMYFLLSSLSLCDIVYITNFVPRMLHDILLENGEFSVLGCITQLNVFGTTGNTMSLTYALMAFDRYLAISNPLRYSSLINNKLILFLIGGVWLYAFTCTITVSILLGELQFCGSNIIDHVYCDFSPFVELSFSDTYLVYRVSGFMSIQSTLLPFIMIFLSYALILNTVLKIPSISGRKKTFSTCSSHLIVVTIYYGIFISIYAIPNRTNSAHINKGLSFVYLTITPLVSPIIYTLKNNEFRGVLDTKITKLKNFKNINCANQ